MPFFTNWTTPFGPTNSVYIGNLKKSRSIDFHTYLRNLALSSRLDRSYNFIINHMRYSILIATALVVWWKDRKQYVFEKFAWSCTLLNLLQQPHNGSSCHTMCLISHSFVEKNTEGTTFLACTINVVQNWQHNIDFMWPELLFPPFTTLSTYKWSNLLWILFDLEFEFRYLFW